MDGFPSVTASSQALVCGHWGGESRNHYCCDVTLGEDLSHILTDHGPANNATLSKIALAIVQLCGFHNVPKALTCYSVQRDEVLDAIPKSV